MGALDRSAASSFVYAKASGLLSKSFVGDNAGKLFSVQSLRELYTLLFEGEVPSVPEVLLSKEIEEKAEKKADDGIATFDDFMKIKLVAAKVVACEKVEKSDKLLKETLDIGNGQTKTVCSGIAKFYEPDTLVGKNLILLINLAPRKMMGRESQGMLLSGRYRVAQAGGPGNSLGRIIFRFRNNFDVFLHDTSSPGVFNRDNRGVSHGCVRVQRPFDLARFLIEKDIDEQPDSLIRSQAVARVPIFITYYTLFRTPDDGQYRTYPDVYGYDRVIYQALTPYLK